MRLAYCLAVVGAAALAGCATSPSSTSAAPAGKTAATKPARTAEQIRMDELLDDPGASAVFKKHAPELASNPQVSMARGMTLAEVAGYSQAGLTPELVKAIVDDVNKL